MLGDLRITLKIEIHGKKGQIGGNIGVSETVVKFDAVDDFNPIGKINMVALKSP